jgi:DNA-binding NtrC family response regulator
MNVLLIENEEFFAENLCDYLKGSANINIQYATKVEKALSLLSKQQFDLVVSEIQLPDSVNDEWLLEIGKLNPKQKLIIMSSHQVPKNLSLSEELNIIGYFEKPFDVKIIANLIKQLTN